MQFGVVQCSEVQCYLMQSGSVSCGAMQYSVVQCSAGEYKEDMCSAVMSNVVSVVQCCAVFYKVVG